MDIEVRLATQSMICEFTVTTSQRAGQIDTSPRLGAMSSTRSVTHSIAPSQMMNGGQSHSERVESEKTMESLTALFLLPFVFLGGICPRKVSPSLAPCRCCKI